MKISVDGGALGVPSYKRFGTYTFTLNLLMALSMYDRNNSYYIYAFSKKPQALTMYNNFFYKVMLPKLLWMKVRVSFEEFVSKKDIFLALNQALPLMTKARVIGFSHGLSFLRYPRLYSYSSIPLRSQLNTMVKRCSHIVVSSQKVKEELLHDYPDKMNNIIVLPCGLPFDFAKTKHEARQNYFLFSGMNHPIKNVDAIVDAFQIVTQKKEYSKYSLYLVGPFEKYKKRHKRIVIYPRITRDRLKELYQKATAYLTASLYESFNFPILEALSQGCPVIGHNTAIIPEFEQYCAVSRTKEEFVEYMVQAASGKLHAPPLELLKEQFSWEAYVKGLVKLYHS